MSTTSLTQKQKKQLRSRKWRINHLYKIRNKDGLVIPFEWNHVQQHFNDNKHNKNIILKSRQHGVTTERAIDQLDTILFTPGISCLFIAETDDLAKEIFKDKIMFGWNHFNEELKTYFGWEEDSKRANRLEFLFPMREGESGQNNSYVAVRKTGRSGTFQKIHISEFGKICAKHPERALEIVTGAFPSLSRSGELTIESTAEGDSGHFHDMYYKYRHNRKKRSDEIPMGEYKTFFYNWRWDIKDISSIPDDQVRKVREMPKFFRDKAKEHKLSDREATYLLMKWELLGRNYRTLRQEYPTTDHEAFLTSGNRLLDSEIIKQHERFIQEPIRKQGLWSIYEEPNQSYFYAIGGDPSGGQGNDHAAGAVWCFSVSGKKGQERPRIVATFANEYTNPEMFAHELKNIGFMFNTALQVVEQNNHGHAVLNELKKIYPEDRIYKRVNTKRSYDERTDQLGFRTDSATKPQLISSFETAINTESVYIPDEQLLIQARTYTREDLSRVTAHKNQIKHWDLFMAAAFGYEGRKYADMAMDANTYIVGGVNALPNAPHASTYNTSESFDFDPHAGI